MVASCDHCKGHCFDPCAQTFHAVCFQSSSSLSSSSPSSSSSLLRFLPPPFLPASPSFRIGILTPCSANLRLSGVLSHTPGNFLAENTWKGSLKWVASTGDTVLPLGPSLRTCKSRKENRNLGRQSQYVGQASVRICRRNACAYLKMPSVRTLRS